MPDPRSFMLTLMLLRHAKAEPVGRGDDFARTLTDKGCADAVRLGVYCCEQRLLPDLALVSGSARTRQTFERLAAGATARIETLIEDDLFNATADEIGNRLRSIDTAVRTLMIVGHNPGIMEAAIAMARDGDIIDLDRLRNRFPPCTLAVVTFDRDDWSDARSSGGRLDYLVLPDDLAS